MRNVRQKRLLCLNILRQGDISAGRAAKLLNISRWDLSELMSAVGISPFAELTAEDLAIEVETALRVLSTDLRKRFKSPLDKGDLGG